MSGTVMIADDDRNLRQLLKKTLMKQGYEVIAVSDGEQAVAQYREADVVLLDIIMPKKTGFDVLREIRQESSMPVVVMSGEVTNKALFREWEIVKFMPKPVELRDVVDTINGCFETVNNLVKLDEAAKDLTKSIECLSDTIKQNGAKQVALG